MTAIPPRERLIAALDVPDAAQARAWYAKAAEFGSGEASRRLEQLAQSSR